MATRFGGRSGTYFVPDQLNELSASDPSRIRKLCRLFDRRAKGTTAFSLDTWKVAGDAATLHVGLAAPRPSFSIERTNIMAKRFGWYRPLLAVFCALSFLLSGGWAQPAAADVEGNTYTSPNYRYTITWDDTWFVGDEQSNPNYDYLELTNGVTWAYFYGGPDPSSNPEGSLALTLSGMHSEPSYSDIAPLRDESGDAVRFTDVDRAYAAFTLTQTMENGSTMDLAVYVEIRQIDTGVYLTLEAYMPVELFESQRPSVEQLVNSFTLPGPDPVPTSTPRPEPTTTPKPKPTASPEPETVLVNGEPAPVVVSDAWRVGVVAAALNTELAGVKLEEKPRKEWLVVVLDVTNWSDEDGQLSAEEFSVRFEGRAKPVNIAPSSTRKVASRLKLEPTSKEYVVEVGAGETTRVALVYSLPTGSRGLELLHGDIAIPLDDMVAVDLRPKELPAPAGPPELVSGQVLSKADANTLNIRIEGEVRSERFELLGVEPLGDASCLAKEAEKLLDGLAGASVLIEEDDELTGGTPARYIWLTNDDGTRTLLNQLLIAEGMVQAGSIPAAARFGLWFETTANAAKTDQIDLLTGCVAQDTASEILGQLSDAVPTATATPKVDR
jgi:hypothetical protein